MMRVFITALASLPLASFAFSQSQSSAGHDIASGTGTVAKAPVKGAADVAKGTAGAVADVATLHPIDAGVSAGKGAVNGGKDVAVGTAKGTAKVTRGIGKVFKKIL